MTDLGDNGGAEMMAHQQPLDEEGLHLREIMEHHFIETLTLPECACDWLIGLWDAIQFMDDVADGDEIRRPSFDRALCQMLVAMPSNPFFKAYSDELLPVVAVQILKWQASDWVERNGGADERSYMWRAGYYDVVLLVVLLCHGHEVAVESAPLVMSLYGETMKDYKREFSNA